MDAAQAIVLCRREPRSHSSTKYFARVRIVLLLLHGRHTDNRRCSSRTNHIAHYYAYATRTFVGRVHESRLHTQQLLWQYLHAALAEGTQRFARHSAMYRDRRVADWRTGRFHLVPLYRSESPQRRRVVACTCQNNDTSSSSC
ncbi:unnamed protein product [Trichogramma brassicae]|uniref:Uncharacterized protein n=1 Tax=Trichogramma brassicae TaxID=86971 RepID=A0A6H5J5T4_9HYME|nr:unnamed protein product [Trichogramma brassicae]